MKRKKNVGLKPLMVSISSIIILLLCMIFTLLSFNNKTTKQLVYDCLADKAVLYIELLEKEIVNVSQTIKVMLIRDMEELYHLPEKISPQDEEYYEIWTGFQEYNFSKATIYNHKYSFYEYVYDADLLVVGDASYFHSSNKPKFLSHLTDEIRGVVDDNINVVVWDFFETEEEIYLYACFQREGKVVGCVTTLNEIMEDVNITNLGYEGFLLFSKNGEFYAGERVYEVDGMKELLPQLQKISAQKTKHFAWDTYTIRYLGDVKLVIALTSGVLERIEGVQFLSICIFVLLIILMFGILWYLYNNVLWPMKKFVDRLRNPDEEIYLNQKEDEGPLEIVYASEQFKKMYREIQSLRIDVYERELEEKRIMLEYAQVQIRPHFFLNCMSVVQSMAELRKEEEIVHVLDVLSEYMRYVLKDTSKKCRIEEEIKHVRDFMEMQKLCKPGAFTFNVMVEDDVKECKIIPLVLQVFAENAIKHGLSSERVVEITIYITSMVIENEDYVYIVVSDTGNGFPQEILELIEKDEPIVYDGCEHLGIRNTFKRIRMTYGEKADININNMRKGYGAIVEITLPSEK